MNKFAAAILSVIPATIFSAASAAQAQSIAPRYTSIAPDPRVSQNSETQYVGTTADGVVHFSAVEFLSDTTSDGNLFITRVIGQSHPDNVAAVQIVQVDCGRGLFRVTRMTVDGEPVVVDPFRWEYLSFDPERLAANIMVRSCEVAAQDRGIDLVWVRR